MVTVTVNSVVDGEWYEGRVVRTVCESNQKSVFQFLSTRLYSLGIPETVKLKIAVKSKGNE